MSIRKEKKMTAAAASQVAIPAAVITEVNDCMIKATGTITPFADTLTPEEIKRLAKANGKTYGFLSKALEFCQHNPQFLSSLFTMEDFVAYMSNVNLLIASEMKAKQVSTLLTTTRITNAAAAYEVALNYYNSVKIAAKKNAPGAQDIYKELSARFPGRKKNKPTPVVTESIAPNEIMKVA